MKPLKILLALLLCSFAVPKQNATDVLRKMYERYHGKWQKTLKFVQHTEKYRNDSLVSTETWYETIVYPSLFRIDIGNPADGNCLVFRYDSVYRFKNHILDRQKKDQSYLLYLIGGMYYEPSAEAVANKLMELHYDIKKGYSGKWKNRKVYVIGANNEQEKTNQLFIAKDNYNILKSVKYEDGKKTEVIFEGHSYIGGGWTETLVTFYTDGHLMQKEMYSNIVANDPIDTAMFHPATVWQNHWFNAQK